VKGRHGLKRPFFVHAARVAAVATLLIGIVYVVFVVVFDTVDSHHLVAQVDASLHERLTDASHHGKVLPTHRQVSDGDDVDSAPIVLWRIEPNGSSSTLTDGAPVLPTTAWVRSAYPVTVDIAGHSFRLDAEPVNGGGWLAAGKSLAEQTHVEQVLLTGELIAGPVLLLTIYLGTLVIGLKASGPIEQARRRQLEFTADASHELRTPLSVIEAEVGLALRSPRDATRYRDTLERVGRESDRLRRLVEDLLWLARFDSEPPPPSDEPVDLAAIADGCADRFGAVAQSRGTVIAVVREGDAQAWISAPPEWVDRLTGVLVDNACRYAGRDGIVRIVVKAQGTWVSLAVEDSGPGIATDERPHLFDRFHRATDQGTGAGLGLAIADSVVRSTGGRWRIGDAQVGGARLEVSWHRSGPREAGLRFTSTRDGSGSDLRHEENQIVG
jgi:signal transduction histidine kinase